MNLFERLKNTLCPPPAAPDAPPPSPEESLLAALARRMGEAPETPFAPFRPAADETTAPLRAALAALEAALPAGDRVYFETSQERYLAILALAAPFAGPGRRVLDVGCSPGHVSIVLDGLGCECHGIDFSEEYARFYPPEGDWTSRLRVRTLDFEAEGLPFPDAHFDLLLFTEVLEHVAVRRPWELLAELRRVLKPGAPLILTTPNFANVGQLLALASLRNGFWAPDMFYGSTQRHNREYVPGELVELIGRAPFEGAEYYLMNAEHNWNGATIDEARALSRAAEAQGSASPLFYNTLLVRARAAVRD